MNEIQEKKDSGVISFRDVFAFFSALVVILNSGYYRSIVTDSYLPIVFFMCLIALGMLFDSQNILNHKINLTVTLLFLGIVLSIVANLSIANSLSGFRVLITMLCSYILISIVPLENFTRYFTAQIKIIIVLSAILQPIIFAEGSNLPRINDYYDLIIITSRSPDRACGVFWEPGVFASMIIISMLFDYYICKNKITVLGITLYVLGIFMTKSTAGYLLLFIVLLGLAWQKIVGLKQNVLSSIVFIAIVVAITLSHEVVIDFLVELNPDVFEKLVETNSATTSTRLNGPLINLEVFFERPLFGWGFTGSATEILDRMYSSQINKVVAQTSTSTQIMASIGILGIIYSVAFVFPMFQKKKLSHLLFESKTIIAICMLLIVNKEPHIFIVATWLMLFYINQQKAI